MRRIAILLVLFLVPFSGAQNPDAFHPSPDYTKLYAHGTGANEARGFMNTMADDGNDNAMGPASSCEPYEGVELLADDVTRTYTFTLNPALVGDLTLDTSADVVFSMHLGAGSCDGEVIDVDATLTYGGTVVAEGSDSHEWVGGAPYPLLEIRAKPKVETLAAGAALEWTIDIDGTYYGMLFLGVSSTQGYSNVELPITSVKMPEPEEPEEPEGPSPPVSRPTNYKDFTTPTAGAALEFTEPHNERYVYNWTSTFDTILVTYNFTFSAGNIDVLVVDPNGKAMLDTKLTASIAGNQTIGAAPQGMWQVTLVFYDYVGIASFSLHEASADPPVYQPGNDEPVGTDSTQGSGGSTKKKSPGVGVLLVPALAGLALWRRRS